MSKLFDSTGREINGGHMWEVVVTPVILNADAYDAGDVLFDRTLVSGACLLPDVPCVLDALTLLDGDDQAAAAMELYFLKADVTLGTKDSAISISDANALNLLGAVSLASGDFRDTINSKIAVKTNIGLPIFPVTGTRDIYVAATTAGTPTQTTGGITLRLIFRTPN